MIHAFTRIQGSFEWRTPDFGVAAHLIDNPGFRPSDFVKRLVTRAVVIRTSTGNIVAEFSERRSDIVDVPSTFGHDVVEQTRAAKTGVEAFVGTLEIESLGSIYVVVQRENQWNGPNAAYLVQCMDAGNALHVHNHLRSKISPAALQPTKGEARSRIDKAVVVMTDIRGFTKFSAEKGLESSQLALCIGRFQDLALVLFPVPYFFKNVGDGVLMIWDVEKLSVEFLEKLIDCSVALEKLWPEVGAPRGRFNWPVPPDVGVGISFGTVSRVPVLGTSDYLGWPINLASKLQGLAEGGGIAIDGMGLGSLLDQSTKHSASFRSARPKFPRIGPHPVRTDFELRVQGEVPGGDATAAALGTRGHAKNR